MRIEIANNTNKAVKESIARFLYRNVRDNNTAPTPAQGKILITCLVKVGFSAEYDRTGNAVLVTGKGNVGGLRAALKEINQRSEALIYLKSLPAT